MGVVISDLSLCLTTGGTQGRNAAAAALKPPTGCSRAFNLAAGPLRVNDEFRPAEAVVGSTASIPRNSQHCLTIPAGSLRKSSKKSMRMESLGNHLTYLMSWAW